MIRRPVDLRRTWLFVAGAEAGALERAPASGADVLIQELEDFTRPEDRPAARALAAAGLYDRWRASGAIAAVRVNPLEDCGSDDLAAVMAGRPDVVMLPKVTGPDQIRRLAEAIAGHERRLGIAAGCTEIVPNVESARGLRDAFAICGVSSRVVAALLAAEDLATDLGCERTPDMAELDHARRRFHVDCVAAGVLAIDMPYTWVDPAGARRHAESAHRMGYRAKSAVDPAHVPGLNEAFTPQPAALAAARRIVAAFEQARRNGAARAQVDGIEVEVPIYRNALATIERAGALAQSWTLR